MDTNSGFLGFGFVFISGWRFLLDRPVSNSGKIKRLMLEVAGRYAWPRQVELVQDPDAD